MSSNEKNKHILIIRLSSFGDVLLASSTVKSIKSEFPDAMITFVVKKMFSVMIENLPEINHLVIFEDIDSTSELYQRNFDLVVDLQNNIRSAKLIKNLKSDKIVSYQKHRIARFFYIKFGFSKFNSPIKSIPQRYLDAVKTVYPNVVDHPIAYHVQDVDYYKSYDLTANKFIVLAPGAAHFTKQWPVDYVIDLIQKIKAKYSDVQIVLLGGPTETDTSKIITDEISDVVNLVGKTTFDQSASIINQASLVVCNDSSIMHLAAALIRKVLVFFGSTTEKLGFFPYNTAFSALEQKTLSCRPCTHIGRKSCPKGHFKCMKDITPEYAFNKLVELKEASH